MKRREARGWAAAIIRPGDEVAVGRTPEHYKTDADLAVSREARALAQLPEGERSAFEQLWSDVDHLLTKATAGK